MYIKNKITIEALEKYLANNNWIHDSDFANKKIKLYRKKIDDDESTLFLPAKNTFKDSARRINDSIEILSEIKNTTIAEITKEILNENNQLILISNNVINKPQIKNIKDTLSVRIISNLSKEGSIPLDYASNVIDGLKKLILSAIVNEENPQPFSLRSNRYAQNQLCNYKLGQTQVGSYIFNIEMNNEFTEGEQLQFIDTKQIEATLSPERKIIKRIQNGISELKVSTIEELFENSYKKGLNANMCDALLNLNIENNDIEIESMVKWSDLVPKPNDIQEKVIIKNTDFYKVKALSDKYKENKSITLKIIGNIIRLSHRKDSHENTIERYIIVQTDINGKYKNIKIELSDQDYKIACEAHKQDKNVVITGEILKQGKYWTMTKYTDFTIL